MLKAMLWLDSQTICLCLNSFQNSSEWLILDRTVDMRVYVCVYFPYSSFREDEQHCHHELVGSVFDDGGKWSTGSHPCSKSAGPTDLLSFQGTCCYIFPFSFSSKNIYIYLYIYIASALWLAYSRNRHSCHVTSRLVFALQGDRTASDGRALIFPFFPLTIWLLSYWESRSAFWMSRSFTYLFTYATGLVCCNSWRKE